MGTIHPSKISGKDVQCIFVLTTDTNSSIQSLRYVKEGFFTVKEGAFFKQFFWQHQ